MFKLAKTVAVLGLVLAVGSVASAATISYDGTIDSAKTDWINTLSLQQFNTSLGHLNSVTISFDSEVSSLLTVKNVDSALGSTGSAFTTVATKVKDRGGYLSKSINVSTDSFDYDLAKGQTVTSDPLAGSGSALVNKSTTAGLLAEFTKIGSGTGYVTLDANTITSTWVNNTGGNYTSGQVTEAGVSATVTYDYTVPEPSTMCLLGVGAILGMLRRRRKAVVTE